MNALRYAVVESFFLTAVAALSFFQNGLLHDGIETTA
jgi:hypothetical protein